MFYNQSDRSFESSEEKIPLKQRTSSIDQRRDYSTKTWLSLLQLLKIREYFITVDNFSIWRRHLAWAIKDGADLRGYMTQRYASNMVFMSLLLGAELNVLFNSDWIATQMRAKMREGVSGDISFWIGVIMMVSVFLTILSLFSTFVAWGMVSAVSDSNAHCVLRSSIGQYVAELPGRFIAASFYFFLVWSILYTFLLLPVGYISVGLVIVVLILFFHLVVVFSSFGRLIMHSGAMGSDPVFEKEFEYTLLPHSLHSHLLVKAKSQLKTKTSIMRQYRFPVPAMDRKVSEGTLTSDIIKERKCIIYSNTTPASLSSSENQQEHDKSSSKTQHHRPNGESGSNNSAHAEKPSHKRKTSSVRFANDFLSSLSAREVSSGNLPPPPPPQGSSRQHLAPRQSSLRNKSYLGMENPSEYRLQQQQQQQGSQAMPPTRNYHTLSNISQESIDSWLSQGGSVASGERGEPQTPHISNIHHQYHNERENFEKHGNVSSRTTGAVADSNNNKTIDGLMGIIRPKDIHQQQAAITSLKAQQQQPDYSPSSLHYPPPPPPQSSQSNLMSQPITSSSGAISTRPPHHHHGISNASSIDSNDHFAQEYGFNPDKKEVMPSPAPPKGIKYAKYFEETSKKQSSPSTASSSSEKQQLLPSTPSSSKQQQQVATSRNYSAAIADNDNNAKQQERKENYPEERKKKKKAGKKPPSSLRTSRKWGSGSDSGNDISDGHDDGGVGGGRTESEPVT